MGETQEEPYDLASDLEEKEEDETLDPRVQEELDRLNQASAEINRLENEIDEARAQYRQTFSEASQRLGHMGTKEKNCIQRARPYYVLKEHAVQAQREALRAARQFQSANTVYRAAKETILLAEQRLVEESHTLTAAWQEMLNHATIRVMEAEKEKTRSEAEHHLKASVFSDLETQLHGLEKKFKRSISKARPYFELKAELELKLKQQKQNIEDLQAAVKATKVRYAASLRQLELISEAIHEARRQRIMMLLPRQPGVGAECDSVTSSSLSDISGLELDSITKHHLSSLDGEADEDSDSDPSYEEVFEGEPSAKTSQASSNCDRYVEGKRSPNLSTHSKYSADGAENGTEQCVEVSQTVLKHSPETGKQSASTSHDAGEHKDLSASRSDPVISSPQDV